MEQSRYGKYKQKKTPGHKRSRMLEGSFEDRNRWIRCWNCQSINDLNRVSGDPDRAGNIYLDDIDVSEIPILKGDDPINGYYTSLNLACTFDSVGQVGTLMELGPDGSTPILTKLRQVKVETPVGCFFCGETDL